jgi:hypothetical protein
MLEKAESVETVRQPAPRSAVLPVPRHAEALAGHQSARAIYGKIADNIARIMQGQAGATRKLLAALASGGHVLLEDFPGTG